MLAPAIEFRPITDIGGYIRDVLQTFAKNADVDFQIRTSGGRRSESENALIALAQAGKGRNPFYLKQQEAGFIAEQISRLLRGRGYNWKNVADAVLVYIKEHVRAQVSASGMPFRPLSKEYAAYKRRKFGFTSPILKATGDLLGGLRVLVNRRNNAPRRV